MTLSAMAAQGKTDIDGHTWVGRRVLVVGLGRSGESAAVLLSRMGAHVMVTDAQDTPLLQQRRRLLYDRGVLQVELGNHSQALLDQAELVVVSPGVNEHVEPLRLARQRGISVISEIELAYYFCRAPIVAVTGTNGKSSAVTLVQQVLQVGGRRVVAGGNLGTPFTALVEDLVEEDIAVVEVSSFQLMHCYRFRPYVAVVLNLGINHLDRHGSLEAYHQAKMRIGQAQEKHDWLVLNADDPLLKRYAQGMPASPVWFGRMANGYGPHILDTSTKAQLELRDQMALQVARIFGVPDPLAWQAIRSFRGLEHRLEWVAAARGRIFINDAKSTTPESTLYALERMREPVVLIAGGRNKGIDMWPLVKRLQQPEVLGVVFIGENRAQLYADCLTEGFDPQRMYCADNLAEALQQAWRLSTPGSAVLLSPAHASFDMFANFEERGRAFKDLVRAFIADLV